MDLTSNINKYTVIWGAAERDDYVQALNDIAIVASLTDAEFKQTALTWLTHASKLVIDLAAQRAQKLGYGKGEESC